MVPFFCFFFHKGKKYETTEKDLTAEHPEEKRTFLRDSVSSVV
jgi:hypothetical protein